MQEIQVTSSAGKKYGHVAGHQYHDVDVKITRSKSGRWKVEIVETWGSCQGYCEEERGPRIVCAQGTALDEAVLQAGERAEAAGMDKSYLTQALSEAEAEAADEAEMVAGEETGADLSKVTTEQLLAELRSRGVTAA